MSLTDRRIRGLYVIVDPAACRGRDPVAIARDALDGGTRAVQWRDKLRDKGDQLADARAIASLCREHDATFIVNDHTDLALAAGAHGVHLGQRDLPIGEARRLWPAPGKRFGLSTHNEREALIASRLSPDYIGVGPVFATPTKAVPDPVLGPGRMGTIIRSVPVPAVALGGIDGGNLAEVLRRGARNFCVVRAVNLRPDPETAIRELQCIWRQVTNGNRALRTVP